MSATVPRRRHRRGAVAISLLTAGTAVAGLGAAFLALLITDWGAGAGACPSAGPASGVVLGPAEAGITVGATEYGGPGDPGSGHLGASGADLLQHPDSYAELGGYTFQTATAMGGLPYLTPLRISWGRHSAIAYKRDFGYGGPPIDGRRREIDLWWQLAERLGIPYEDGLWSGGVQIARPPATGAAGVLGAAGAGATTLLAPPASEGDPAACAPAQASGGVPVTTGPRAGLLPDGLATAPADAPAAVAGIIGAGNQIAGRPYLYGGGHGVTLDTVAPAYDCSSSVEHLLYGGGLLPVGYDAASGELESFGLPGPGRWVTIYASADHVFMYVAGLRWDTHNAAGAGDGGTGIGWHPLVRNADGFVARHPVGL